MPQNKNLLKITPVKACLHSLNAEYWRESLKAHGNSPVEKELENAKSFAIFRLVNPHAVIKFAAGRETVMKDFHGLLILAGVNGFLTGGYLTTRGRSVGEDVRFINEMRGLLTET
ncbi:MAG: hypothetical protein A2014_03975 [Spirochaetes bacterium GWF1_49_6]|nr:MAG: hypothetical protein A2014_03975 [Spirochaetes bacterium GWF1_49_6]